MSFTDYGDLQSLINTGAAVAIETGGYPRACPNCHGLESVMVFRVKHGPVYSIPLGEAGIGAKWLDHNGRQGWYLGKIEAVECPVCAGGHKADFLRRMCNLSDKDEFITLEEFDDLPGKHDARQAMIDLLALNLCPNGFTTFWGSFGRGKSFALKCLVNGFRMVGVLARYSTMADLLADAREKFGDSLGSAEAVIEHYRSLPVLCIDEVDRVNLTGWARETLHRLLDARYNQRGEILTVLASNLAPEKMPVDFGYLASRMRGGQVVEIAGLDMRPAVAVRERADVDA